MPQRIADARRRELGQHRRRLQRNARLGTPVTPLFFHAGEVIDGPPPPIGRIGRERPVDFGLHSRRHAKQQRSGSRQARRTKRDTEDTTLPIPDRARDIPSLQCSSCPKRLATGASEEENLRCAN
jgi:hypothetical protein